MEGYVNSLELHLVTIWCIYDLWEWCDNTTTLLIENCLQQDDDEVLGFASLPDQVHRKAVKRGFDFTLMVVGEFIITSEIDHTYRL